MWCNLVTYKPIVWLETDVKNMKYVGLTKTCRDSWDDQGRETITFQESLAYMLQYGQCQQQSYNRLCCLHTVCQKTAGEDD